MQKLAKSLPLFSAILALMITGFAIAPAYAESDDYSNTQEHDYEKDSSYGDDSYDDRHGDDSYDHDYYEKDPDYEHIGPLKDRILANISMEEIDSFWMRGDIGGLTQLILSKTDLTEEEVKRVIAFFQKYDDHEKHDYREYDDYKRYDHEYKDYGDDSYDHYEKDRYYGDDSYEDRDYESAETQRLEQRVAELEQENRELRDIVSDLEQKLQDLNAVVMEQIKIIYDWVLAK